MCLFSYSFAWCVCFWALTEARFELVLRQRAVFIAEACGDFGHVKDMFVILHLSVALCCRTFQGGEWSHRAFVWTCFWVHNGVLLGLWTLFNRHFLQVVLLSSGEWWRVYFRLYKQHFKNLMNVFEHILSYFFQKNFFNLKGKKKTVYGYK